MPSRMVRSARSGQQQSKRSMCCGLKFVIAFGDGSCKRCAGWEVVWWLNNGRIKKYKSDLWWLEFEFDAKFGSEFCIFLAGGRTRVRGEDASRTGVVFATWRC